MKLTDLSLESIKTFISGDSGFTPGLSGPNILNLFNKVGFKDVYKWNDDGMPNTLSRNAYVLETVSEDVSRELAETFASEFVQIIK